MAARRKAAALDVPATRAEAEALVRDYARLEHYASDKRGAADAKIAAIKEERDELLSAITSRQSAIFAQLKAWWETTGKDEAKGKRSIDVDGTEIGLRLTTPKLGFKEKMKEADVLKWLMSLRWAGRGRYIRVKHELDKQAVIKALTDDKAAADAKKTLSQHCTVTQKDEFYIKTAALEKPTVEGPAAEPEPPLAP